MGQILWNHVRSVKKVKIDHFALYFQWFDNGNPF